MAKQDQAAPVTSVYHLVVVHPFGDYQRGDKITDPITVSNVLASENEKDCHKVIAQ